MIKKRLISVALICIVIISLNCTNIFAVSSLNFKITGVHAYGSYGYEIKQLYEVLWKLGFSLDESSYGYYESKVECSIKAIQKYHGLKIDGILGYGTTDVINYLLSINNSKMRATLKKYQDDYLIRKSNASLNGQVLFRNGRNIYFRGTEYTNVSSRNGRIPQIIVDHITDTESFTSTNLWFTKSYNNQSSAHFVVGRDGIVYQYVHITKAAWANGIKNSMFNYVKSDYVKFLGYGVNSYTVSIEHIGVSGYLTKKQLDASVWLHKYIRDFVRNTYGYTIPLNRKHVIGHYEIDPINRPYCPGPQFPWSELMDRLN